MKIFEGLKGCIIAYQLLVIVLIKMIL